MFWRSLRLLMLLALVVCGCGTYLNMRCQHDWPKPGASHPPMPMPFGGVALDIDVLCNTHQREPLWALLGVGIAFGDMPLSFVGDIVTLPFTLASVFDPPPPYDNRPREPSRIDSVTDETTPVPSPSSAPPTPSR